MNERFKELFIQVRNESENMRWNIEDAERFAELIVLECASIFERVHTFQLRPERIDTRIKEHFGVEEWN